MIKLYKSLLKKQKPFPNVPLGRWNILKCDISLERRVALANTDHCGPCSYEELYHLKKNTLNCSESDGSR